MTQRVQVFIQNNVISATLKSGDKISAPWFMKAIAAVPALRSIPAQMIGVGLRPEHIQTPDVLKGKEKSRANA